MARVLSHRTKLTSTSLFPPTQIPTTPARRTANHWIGSCKLGLDDGRRPNGTAVVDPDTRVYGMDNLFVVDGSIFPGIMTGNPSAMIGTFLRFPRLSNKIPQMTRGWVSD